MKIIGVIPRILLGLVFGVMPWMAVLHLAPNPPMPPAATAFVTALARSGYMLPLVWGTEIVGGLLVLSGIFVPFALVLLAPVVVNIFLYHVFLNRSGLGLAIVICALEMFVAWQHRRAFEPLFISPPASEPLPIADRAAAAPR
jgi:uncharacterized membrane protein YphA (DoxX/SURF4 family)